MSDPRRSECLVQDAWLRRVARALVKDQHLAEDLAQDAWVASVEHRRFGPDARHWLRGLLRNRTSAHFRQRAAREQRERQSGAQDLAPAPDEVLAELQLRERVAHELGALDEPYRTALYLRFIAGHSLRETARRMGVAPATATERVQAGLARLRRRLDGAHGGERRAWFLPLLPWARTSASLATSISTSISIAMLSVLTLAAVFFGPSTPFHAHPATARIDPGLEASALASSPEPATLVRSASSERAAAPSIEREAQSSSTVHDSASVTGTFLRPDGAPAAGASWLLKGLASNSQLVQDYGTPEAWVDPSGVLDASGCLDLAFGAHPAFQYFLTVRHTDLVPATWRWGSIDEDEQHDLGEVTLRAAGRIVGTVVDPTGAPLDARTWFVYAREAGLTPGLGLQAAAAGPIATTTAARFEIDGMPAGPVALSLYVPELGPLQGPTVTVVAGQTVEANIVVSALGEYADSIVARFRMQPSVNFPGPSAQHVWLVRPNGERRPARRDTVGFVFDDVGPGQHRVEVDDPRLAAWSRDGLAAGAFVHGELCGNANVEFRVTRPGGESVPAFSVDARSEGVLYSSSRFLAATEAAPLPGGVLALVPGDYMFTLESAGVSASVAVRGLVAGETRIVPVTLDAARLVRGRVVHADGQPAAKELVRLVTPALFDDSLESPILDGDTLMVGDTGSARHQVSRAVTDTDGRFTLAPGAGSEHIVVVGRNLEPQVESARLDTSAGAHVGELELVLERGARLIVHIEPPAGLSTAEWDLVFVRSGPTQPGVFATPYTHADNSGRFVLGPIPAGHGQLVLVTAPGPMVPGVVPAHGMVLAELTLVAGETRTERYPYPGPAPVAVTIDVSSGVAAEHPVTVVLVPTAGAGASVASGPASEIGPLVVVPGTYVAWLRGADWRARVADLTVSATGATIAIDPVLSERRVRIVDSAGAPLRDQALLLVEEPNQLDAPTLTTDGDGWVDLRLGAGSYTLGLDTLDPTLAFRTASHAWPLASGVEVVTVQ